MGNKARDNIPIHKHVCLSWKLEQTTPAIGLINRKNRKLFEAWGKEDPVDNWECDMFKNGSIQGNVNPFVKNACVELEAW